MKYKFIFLLSALLIINVVHAQWHFSITSMNYQDNCSGLQAMIEVEMRKTIVNDAAARNYSSKEECESGRSAATMNWSSGGCYIRTTTSPCVGGNIGGGGDIGGGGSTGSGFDGIQNNASLYSNIAIGEPYFSPNEAQKTSSIGRDTEIKLEAWNKSSSSARNGIKTGDTSFDDLYKRLSNTVSADSNNGTYTFNTRNEIDPNMSLYVNVKDREKVNLGKDNEYNYDDEDIIVPIDPERIKNQEWDERREKSQKEAQHRIDSIMEKNQHKLDSIHKSQNKPNTTLVLNNKSGENEPSLVNLAIETFQVGSGFIQNVDEGVRYINETFGVTIPGSKQLSNLNSTFNDLKGGIKEIRDMSIIIIDGDLPKFTEKLKAYATDAVAIAVDPYVDKMVGVANTFANTYTKTTDIITNVGNPLKKAVTGYANTVLTGALEAERTGNSGYYDRLLYKETARFSGKMAEITKSQIPK